MPRQSLSVRPQRLLLSGEERVQNEFIKALGPYFARAKFENRDQDFLARTEVFTVPGLIHMEWTWTPWTPCTIPCSPYGMTFS